MDEDYVLKTGIIKIVYLCNRLKCDRCSDYCNHTFDRNFAKYKDKNICERKYNIINSSAEGYDYCTYLEEIE